MKKHDLETHSLSMQNILRLKKYIKSEILDIKKVLIPLAQGCEELEAVTVIDILRRADVDVTTLRLNGETISTIKFTDSCNNYAAFL